MKKILALVLAIALIAGCGKKNETKKSTAQKTTLEEQVKNMMNVGSDEMLVAVMKTNMGTMELELYPHKTPKTVENFVGLAMKGYYKGVTFHRVIDNFMIQGGDPTGTGMGGESFWGGKFQDEFRQDLRFDSPGVLAMANAGPNTNGSQFFITLVPTPWLNGHHTIFGHLIKGMDVLKAIGKVKTGPRDKPVNDVIIESVTIQKRKI